MYSWSPEKKFSEKEKWTIIYPAYINNKRTLAEGRRLPKEKCVENPTCSELKDVLSAAGLAIGIEQNKMYPRDPNRDPMSKGRVRIQLRNDDGTPINAEFPTKMSVMKYCGEMIPKLKSRQTRSGSDQSLQAGAKKSKGKKGKR